MKGIAHLYDGDSLPVLDVYAEHLGGELDLDETNPLVWCLRPGDLPEQVPGTLSYRRRIYSPTCDSSPDALGEGESTSNKKSSRLAATSSTCL